MTEVIEDHWQVINDHEFMKDHKCFKNLKSGRYKLEKKRKQVQRAESENIKDVVLSQIEAEKEPFTF